MTIHDSRPSPADRLTSVASTAQARQRAIEIAPEFTDAWNNLGVVYKERGELDAAIGQALQRSGALTQSPAAEPSSASLSALAGE